MNEPTTAAGRALLALWQQGRTHPPSAQRLADFTALVAAVEAEAWRMGVSGMDEALRLHAESPGHEARAALAAEKERVARLLGYIELRWGKNMRKSMEHALALAEFADVEPSLREAGE